MIPENNPGKVEIELIKVKDLYSFFINYSAKKSKDDLDFITKQRALAHSMNPYAEDDDVGMILASIDGKYVGYLGLIPGVVRLKGKNERIIWPSSMYIIPEARGHSISTLLINKALQLNKVLVITGMGPMSEAVFRHLKFIYLRKAGFSEINFRKLRILPVRIIEKIPVEVIKFITRSRAKKNFSAFILYNLLKKWAYLIIFRKYRADFKNVIYEKTSLLDEALRSRIRLNDFSFPRTLEWINWMLQYKWVINRDEPDQSESNYYFSNSRDYFQYVTLRVLSSDPETEDGFLIFSISEDKGNMRIKLLDHTCGNEAEGRKIAAIILDYGKSLSADSIEIPDSLAKFFDIGIFSKFLISQREWRFIYSASDLSDPVARELEKVDPKSYDGDLAFV